MDSAYHDRVCYFCKKPVEETDGGLLRDPQGNLVYAHYRHPGVPKTSLFLVTGVCWGDITSQNNTGYAAGIVHYAERWGTLLQQQMEEFPDKTPEEVITTYAFDLSRKADTDGITGLMHNLAVSLLVRYWVYGEILRRWHNIFVSIGDEWVQANENGDVLNSSMVELK